MTARLPKKQKQLFLKRFYIVLWRRKTSKYRCATAPPVVSPGFVALGFVAIPGIRLLIKNRFHSVLMKTEKVLRYSWATGARW
jgi:hypothetical protein